MREPAYDDGQARMYVGDSLAVLREMEAESVDCCVTSPPYWNLRSGVAGVLGLEKSPEEYIAKMVAVFDEVRRVLKPEGTCWVNIGDSYATKQRGSDLGWRTSRLTNPARQQKAHAAALQPGRLSPQAYGLKHKDIVGIPWALAFAMRDQGWYLRSEVIWDKPNPQPEAVTDRPTNSHERIFLFAKQRKYFYNGAAIAEPCSPNTHARLSRAAQSEIDRAHGREEAPNKVERFEPDFMDSRQSRTRSPRQILESEVKRLGATHGRTGKLGHAPGWRKADVEEEGSRSNPSMHEATLGAVLTRNKRSVWRVATVPYSGDHFATFPPKLIEPCILAGCPEGGLVLDPFGGTGTVAEVAKRFGRRAVLIDIDPKCVRLTEERIRQMGLHA